MNSASAARYLVRQCVTRLLTAAALLLIVAGCVVIPYRPESDTKHDLAEVPNPESIRLSVAPRRFLEEMADELVDEEARIEVLDGQTFLDTAAPTGDLPLAALLEPATRARIEPLQADYLVLLGEPQAETLSDWGGVAAWVGFYGLGKERASSTYWAAVIDLRRMKIVEQLSTTATGTDAGLGLFYGIFVVSDTEGSAQKGVIRNLARTLAGAKPEGPLRLVLLAKEPRFNAEQLAAMERQRQLELRRTRDGAGLAGVYGSGGGKLDGYPRFAEAAAPNQEEALVYLYRPRERAALLTPLPVRADAGAGEIEVTRLLAGGYFPYRVRPGTLRLWVEPEPEAAIALTVESGGTYYVRAKPRIGWKSWRGGLVAVDAEAAGSDLKRCHLLPSMDDYVVERHKLAEQGYSYEQIEFARLQSTGVPLADGSLPLDRIESYKWYTAVIEAEGVLQWMKDAARRDRDILAADMTTEQIAEGQRRGREWLSAFEREFLAVPEVGSPSSPSNGAPRESGSD